MAYIAKDTAVDVSEPIQESLAQTIIAQDCPQERGNRGGEPGNESTNHGDDALKEQANYTAIQQQGVMKDTEEMMDIATAAVGKDQLSHPLQQIPEALNHKVSKGPDDLLLELLDFEAGEQASVQHGEPSLPIFREDATAQGKDVEATATSSPTEETSVEKHYYYPEEVEDSNAMLDCGETMSNEPDLDDFESQVRVVKLKLHQHRLKHEYADVCSEARHPFDTHPQHTPAIYDPNGTIEPLSLQQAQAMLNAQRSQQTNSSADIAHHATSPQVFNPINFKQMSGGPAHQMIPMNLSDIFHRDTPQSMGSSSHTFDRSSHGYVQAYELQRTQFDQPYTSTQGYDLNVGVLAPPLICDTDLRAPKPHRREQQARAPEVDEHDCGNDSDDDEPLVTRTLRHPSVLSDSVNASSTTVKSTEKVQIQPQHENSDVEVVSSSSKPNRHSTKGKNAPSETANPVEANNVSASASPTSSSSIGEIDWSLPKYDAQFEPGKTKHDPGIAKVSLPGLVREEMFLSPDHAEQEMHLLLNIFLPNQKNLAIPDPKPAQAVLNFHTVAVMVIEAFKQFEIGDELGTGRGHLHQDHDQGDLEYNRQRDAREADPDEIFFAVIDRWRAGMISNKQPSRLIRGAQEFCDLALDLIYYIKEHGLTQQRQRASRKDKVVKRDKKADKDATGTNTGDKEKDKKKPATGEVAKGKTGVKRAGAKDVNELQAKKKPKTEKPKDKAKPTKKKPTTSSVTVVRREKQ